MRCVVFVDWMTLVGDQWCVAEIRGLGSVCVFSLVYITARLGHEREYNSRGKGGVYARERDVWRYY